MNSKEKYFLLNIDKVKRMIEDNRPKIEIAKELSIKWETLNSYLVKYHIDYKGNQHRLGLEKNRNKTPLDKVLNNEVVYSTSELKKRLIEEGIKENKCECCGITEWNGRPIKFELHHVDGNHYNNTLDNLQMLCPNCHSQTDTFRKSSIRRIKINIEEVEEEKNCPVCGKRIDGNRANRKKYCSSKCSDIARRKLPGDIVMLKLIESGMSDSDIAEKYNASESLVKKWRKQHNI